MWKTLYTLGRSFCFIKGQGVVLCSLKRTHSEPQSLGSLTLIPFHLPLGASHPGFIAIP